MGLGLEGQLVDLRAKGPGTFVFHFFAFPHFSQSQQLKDPRLGWEKEVTVSEGI